MKDLKEQEIRMLNDRKYSSGILWVTLILGVFMVVCLIINAGKEEKELEEIATEEQKEDFVYGKVTLGDLNNNGKEDYYTYYAGEEGYHGQMIFYMDEEPIYTYDSEYQIVDAKAEYTDVDGDHRKELFVTWIPQVDSGRLMEYFILDKTADGWRTLEMPHGESIHQNAFPISMVYGAQKGILVISCEGSEGILFFDLREHYEKAVAECEDGSTEQQLYQTVLEGKNHVPGEAFGCVSDGSLYSIRKGEHRQEVSPGSGYYDTEPCMIASHRLEGIGGASDILGNLEIYYQYDESGKIQIKDMEMGDCEMMKIDSGHLMLSIPEKTLSVYYHERESERYDGIYIKREDAGAEGISYYPWTYNANFADSYHPPEIMLIREDTQLFFNFTQMAGRDQSAMDVHETEVHIVDLETMEEIPVQIDPKRMDKYLFSEVGWGLCNEYRMEGDTLVFYACLQVGNSCEMGRIKLEYTYLDGTYQVKTVSYQPEADCLWKTKPVGKGGNDVRRTAYEEAVQILCNVGIYPNSVLADNQSSVFLNGNGYQIADIDEDGRVELVMNCVNMSSMAGMVFYVFDYNVDTKQFYQQIECYPVPEFYDNGLVMARLSHNQGRCNTSANVFWPYDVYQYQPETDTYEILYEVDGWQKEVHPEGFPEEQDIDGDGMVYYLIDLQTFEPTNIMDGAEYEQWKKALLNGASKIQFEFESFSYN